MYNNSGLGGAPALPPNVQVSQASYTSGAGPSSYPPPAGMLPPGGVVVGAPPPPAGVPAPHPAGVVAPPRPLHGVPTPLPGQQTGAPPPTAPGTGAAPPPGFPASAYTFTQFPPPGLPVPGTSIAAYPSAPASHFTSAGSSNAAVYSTAVANAQASTGTIYPTYQQSIPTGNVAYSVASYPAGVPPPLATSSQHPWPHTQFQTPGVPGMIFPYPASSASGSVPDQKYDDRHSRSPTRRDKSPRRDLTPPGRRSKSPMRRRSSRSPYRSRSPSSRRRDRLSTEWKRPSYTRDRASRRSEDTRRSDDSRSRGDESRRSEDCRRSDDHWRNDDSHRILDDSRSSSRSDSIRRSEDSRSGRNDDSISRRYEDSWRMEDSSRRSEDLVRRSEESRSSRNDDNRRGRSPPERRKSTASSSGQRRTSKERRAGGGSDGGGRFSTTSSKSVKSSSYKSSSDKKVSSKKKDDGGSCGGVKIKTERVDLDKSSEETSLRKSREPDPLLDSIEPESPKKKGTSTSSTGQTLAAEKFLDRPLTNEEIIAAEKKIWIRSTPADLYYERDPQNAFIMRSTEKAKVQQQIFKEKLINPAAKAREDNPTRPAPNFRHHHHHHHSQGHGDHDDLDSSSEEEDDDPGFRTESAKWLEYRADEKNRLHRDLWQNLPNELNDGPSCRCSRKARESGIRHGVWVGEEDTPKPLDPATNNFYDLYHYRITISPPTNFLVNIPTMITHDEHTFLFEGFSMFTRRPIPEFPECKIIRFNIEYSILFFQERMPENFTINELDLFSHYFFYELLELWDWKLDQRFIFMPRFARDLTEDGKELLSMNNVLNYLLDSYKPLINKADLQFMHAMKAEKWQIYTAKVRGMLVTQPGKAPSTIRIDHLDRHDDEDKNKKKLRFPEIVHFGLKPSQLCYAGNAEYQKQYRDFVKYRHLLANMPKPTAKDKQEYENMETKLMELRANTKMKRDTTVVVSSEGFYRTGLMADIVQHAMLLPVLVSHLRFHFSLEHLEQRIDYTFNNRFLLQQALTHPGYKENFGTNPDHVRNTLSNCGIRQPEYGDKKVHSINSRKRGINTLINIMSKMGRKDVTESKVKHNERLEYLGDAVVEFITSVHLFYLFPDLEEGGLATYRSAIVLNQNLADLALALGLEKYILFSHGPDLCMDAELRHAMANCFEAFLGAIFLDGGINVADKVFNKSMFEADQVLFDVWGVLPLHPLQTQEPGGDRHWIEKFNHLKKLVKFEEETGIQFKHIRLLARAFTDRSVGINNLTLGSNQRLEFLGDSVLQLVTSEFLYKHFPDHHEGHLSLLRASLVNNRTQAVVCDDLGMSRYAVYSNVKPEIKVKDKADLLEAFLGALYVDKDLFYCQVFAQVCFFPRLYQFILNQDWNDPKSKLQQCCLTLRTMNGRAPDIPIYKVIECKGPSNTRVYTVAVYFRGQRLAKAKGHSIQQAEFNAAERALRDRADLFPHLNYQRRVLMRSFKNQGIDYLKYKRDEEKQHKRITKEGSSAHHTIKSEIRKEHSTSKSRHEKSSLSKLTGIGTSSSSSRRISRDRRHSLERRSTDHSSAAAFYHHDRYSSEIDRYGKHSTRDGEERSSKYVVDRYYDGDTKRSPPEKESSRRRKRSSGGEEKKKRHSDKGEKKSSKSGHDSGSSRQRKRSERRGGGGSKDDGSSGRKKGSSSKSSTKAAAPKLPLADAETELISEEEDKMDYDGEGGTMEDAMKDAVEISDDEMTLSTSTDAASRKVSESAVADEENLNMKDLLNITEDISADEEEGEGDGEEEIASGEQQVKKPSKEAENITEEPLEIKEELDNTEVKVELDNTEITTEAQSEEFKVELDLKEEDNLETFNQNIDDKQNDGQTSDNEDVNTDKSQAPEETAHKDDSTEIVQQKENIENEESSEKPAKDKKEKKSKLKSERVRKEIEEIENKLARKKAKAAKLAEKERKKKKKLRHEKEKEVAVPPAPTANDQPPPLPPSIDAPEVPTEESQNHAKDKEKDLEKDEANFDFDNKFKPIVEASKSLEKKEKSAKNDKKKVEAESPTDKSTQEKPEEGEKKESVTVSDNVIAPHPTAEGNNSETPKADGDNNSDLEEGECSDDDEDDETVLLPPPPAPAPAPTPRPEPPEKVSSIKPFKIQDRKEVQSRAHEKAEKPEKKEMTEKEKEREEKKKRWRRESPKKTQKDRDHHRDDKHGSGSRRMSHHHSSHGRSPSPRDRDRDQRDRERAARYYDYERRYERPPAGAAQSSSAGYYDYPAHLHHHATAGSGGRGGSPPPYNDYYGGGSSSSRSGRDGGGGSSSRSSKSPRSGGGGGSSSSSRRSNRSPSRGRYSSYESSSRDSRDYRY